MVRSIAFKGAPLTLVGRSISQGKVAPDFKVVSPDLKEITLSDFKDKIKVFTTFPSIDTPVCDLQVKEFNKQAAQFGPEVVIIGISMDLPFAQKRFCETFDINNVRTVSDYKYASFGINYGLLIKELHLLARTAMIVDKNNILRYLQIVPELTSAPDYGEALENLKEVVSNPASPAQEAMPSHCQPCEGSVVSLPREKVEQLFAQYRGWELIEEKKLVKEFKYKDFVEAKFALDLFSIIAQEQGHHPNFLLSYNKLRVTLTTHAAGGLTENDFIMAKIIDEVTT